MAVLKDLIVQGKSRFLSDSMFSRITAGAWNGSTIDIAYGGTGATTAAGARANLGTWALIQDSYPTIMPANGSTNNWFKIGTSNSSYGILPSTSGGAGSGHNYIGTSSWYWKYAYIDEIYGHLNGNVSGSLTGNATTASALTSLNSSDVASSTSTWRKLWMCYNDGVTGRPALSDNLAFQTSTNTLKSKYFLAEHTSGSYNEYRVTYGSTVDMAMMIGSGDSNHGLYDNIAGKWMIYADGSGNVTVNGTSTNVTVNDSNYNSTYRLVWHSGNTLYSTDNIYCNPSTDVIYSKGLISYGPINVTGSYDYSEGIRIHHYSGLSSVWFGASNNSGYDAGMWAISVDSNGMRFRGPASTSGTSPNDYMNILHGGNVGIGTASPSYKLHVNGIFNASNYLYAGSNGAVNANNATGTGIYYYSSNGPSTSLGTASTDGALYTEAYSTSWVAQIAQDYRTGLLFTRSRNNGTWTKWRGVMPSDADFSTTDSNIVYNPADRRFTKIAGSTGGWDTQAYSNVGYKECRVTYRIGQTNAYIMVGLNSDPTTDASYNSIDYCWYTQSGGGLYMYENGSSISSISGHTSYAAGDELIVEYSNNFVRYYHNGVLCRTVERAYGTPLHFDCSFYSYGYIYGVNFEPIHAISMLDTDFTLYSASGDSPSLKFIRQSFGTSNNTDWKMYVTGGQLSFASATDGNNFTRRAYFGDGSGLLYASGMYHLGYGSYDYVLTSNGSARDLASLSNESDHYTPNTNTSVTLYKRAGSSTAAEFGLTSMVTGISILRDTKGHVTGLTLDSKQLPGMGSGSGLDADTVDGLHSSSFLRRDANDSTSYQYSFTKTNDHAIQIGTIRGRVVGSRTGEYIHMYERVHIGSPNGWGSNDAPSYGLSTYGGAWLATSTGSVGIGTTSPSYKLHVNGTGCFENTLRINSAYPNLDMHATTAESSIYFRPSSGTSWALGKSVWSVGGFGIGILNDGCKFTILDNGNTGIGTTSPAEKLHVAGIIRASNGSYYLNIRQESSTWSSFYTNASNYYFDHTVQVNGPVKIYNTSYELNSGTSKVNDLRVAGDDLYIGASSGSQCHQQYDATNKCLKFVFD